MEPNGSKKEEYESIKSALISAFLTDKFFAYEQFVTRQLREDEPVDVYLTDLRRLAELFGGIPDAGLSYAFLAGLPEATRHILRAGCCLERMNICQLLNRARVVVASDSLGVGSPTHVSCLIHHAAASASCCSAVRCLAYNQPNRYVRERCYNCGVARIHLFIVFRKRVRTALHGVRSQTKVLFGLEEEQALAVAAATSLDIDERDFKVTFDTNTKQWIVL
ncbi:hypothetical protein O3P69_010962 [Scylla paramamosain]|uniref:Retrotransposon gag domain-containing protein n=1 Tax=Scylla paramamosain TaxID=85552 RepID=A0AAW0SI51_SCYPA